MALRLPKRRLQVELGMQLKDFKGTFYRLCDNWIDIIPLEYKPITYLEIGAFYGANVISVALNYAKHPDSKIVCIDPWCDYDKYEEYKGEMPTIYGSFVENIQKAGVADKIEVLRGFSHSKIPTLKDESFDIIYVDGNHNPDYVLEDCVLCFRKLKVGGYMVMDDYGFGGPDGTLRGMNGFFSAYRDRMKIFPVVRNSQVFVQKLN